MNNDDLQQNPDESNPTEDLKQDERIDNDFDNKTPFSPPNDVQARIDDAYPAADTNISEQELYDAGIEAASGVELPSESEEDQDIPSEAA